LAHERTRTTSRREEKVKATESRNEEKEKEANIIYDYLCSIMF